MGNLVIQGAYYYDNESDTILMPHRTGEYSMVDCNIYVKMKELKNMYDESYIKDNKDNLMHIEYEGQEYFSAEWGPRSVTEEWDLLSDLSELSHFEEDYNFS
uniref:Uncharacterized protein n=1 Tax=viral metagenome TaxID=1070528 RepID=A0A6M3LRE6_9ZZZZ